MGVSGFKVSDFGVQSLRFRIWGSELRGLGFRVSKGSAKGSLKG